MNPETQLTPVEDWIVVSRDDLITVLRWAEQQPTPITVTSAELRLQHELMCHPHDQEDDLEEDDDEPGSRHRAAAITTLICSALFFIGFGVAWLLWVVTGP